jgi:hypothetical protein
LGGRRREHEKFASFVLRVRAWAYFTTRPLSEQWGDDWGDVPYEHNASPPNQYGYRLTVRDAWTIASGVWANKANEPTTG